MIKSNQMIDWMDKQVKGTNNWWTDGWKDQVIQLGALHYQLPVFNVLGESSFHQPTINDRNRFIAKTFVSSRIFFLRITSLLLPTTSPFSLSLFLSLSLSLFLSFSLSLFLSFSLSLSLSLARSLAFQSWKLTKHLGRSCNAKFARKRPSILDQLTDYPTNWADYTVACTWKKFI